MGLRKDYTDLNNVIDGIVRPRTTIEGDIDYSQVADSGFPSRLSKIRDISSTVGTEYAVADYTCIYECVIAYEKGNYLLSLEHFDTLILALKGHKKGRAFEILEMSFDYDTNIQVSSININVRVDVFAKQNN